ncbi:ankyrin repeat domain-containing protein [Candidatus Dependentiae bacterium]|nr:ankyrin repeat domain-containing protein [Candidatus Dependentiae bacterium]
MECQPAKETIFKRKVSSQMFNEETKKLIISCINKNPDYPETFTQDDFIKLNICIFDEIDNQVVYRNKDYKSGPISSLLDFLINLKKFDSSLTRFFPYGLNLLATAALYNYPSIISILLKNKIFNIDSYSDEKTPLMWASSFGNLRVMRLLIKANANLNLQNPDGNTALILASNFTPLYKDSKHAAALLINAKANLDLTNKKGETALISAIKAEQFNTAKLLINSGARVNIADGEGKTALDYAQEKNNKELIDLLKSKGAKSGHA